MSMVGRPMHLHGHVFQVVGLNGRRITGALRDTVYVSRRMHALPCWLAHVRAGVERKAQPGIEKQETDDELERNGSATSFGMGFSWLLGLPSPVLVVLAIAVLTKHLRK